MVANEVVQAAINAAPITKTVPVNPWGPTAYGVWTIAGFLAGALLRGLFPYVKFLGETRQAQNARLDTRIEQLEAKLDAGEQECQRQITSVRNDYEGKMIDMRNAYEAKLDGVHRQFINFQNSIVRVMAQQGGLKESAVLNALLGAYDEEQQQDRRRPAQGSDQP